MLRSAQLWLVPALTALKLPDWSSAWLLAFWPQQSMPLLASAHVCDAPEPLPSAVKLPEGAVRRLWSL